MKDSFFSDSSLKQDFIVGKVDNDDFLPASLQFIKNLYFF